MSDAFYREFWQGFANTDVGPRRYTPDVPTMKNGHGGYRVFNQKWSHGFRLVATASLSSDRIGAEFFTGNSKGGHAFIRHLDPHETGRASLECGLVAVTHLNKTDGKIELLWPSARLKDIAFWPAHFLWLRIALHQLAETLGPRADTFIMDQA